MKTRTDMKVLKFNPDSNEELMLMIEFLNEYTDYDWGVDRFIKSKPPINPTVCSNKIISEKSSEGVLNSLVISGHLSNVSRYELRRYYKFGERLAVVIQYVGDTQTVELMREGEFDDNKDFLVAEVRRGD